MIKSLYAAAAVVALVPAAAMAQDRTASGSYGDLSWTARSNLVAAGRTQGGVGETPWTDSMPGYSGTVGLLMNGFVCSGTLLADRRTILTAAHCVSSGGGVPDVAGNGVTVFFRDPNSGPDVQFYYGGPGYSTQQSSEIFVHESYTGDVIDHNDIALVRLAELAPDTAQAYSLYTGELTGEVGNITGYGSTSSIGGAVGVNTANPNRLGWFREGQNGYDYALGNSVFGTVWAAVLDEPFSQIEYSYVSDFDNGLAVNDTTCRISVILAGPVAGGQFCDVGTGLDEVGVAGGDSGGGGFIDGNVATVNSYGLTFGVGYGDVDNSLNSSWGEFTGYVPVWYHEQWITGNMLAAVPEPSTWAMLLLGFGVAGGAMRRRKQQAKLDYAF